MMFAVRIAGLGGIFRVQIWMPPAPPDYDSPQAFMRRAGKGGRWRDDLALKHRSTIFLADYARLARGNANVLVTHEAPSTHPHGFPALDALARKMKAEATFHGHHHDSLDYAGSWEQLGHWAYGVRFCGITALDGTVIR